MKYARSVLFVIFMFWVLPAHAFSVKNLTLLDQSMQIWVHEAIRQSLALSHTDYEAQISKNAHLFTKKGYNGYRSAIMTSDTFLDAAIDFKSDLIALPYVYVKNEQAFVIREKDEIEDGLHEWKVMVHVALHYDVPFGTSRTKRRTIDYPVILQVRQIEAEAPYDFKISRWYIRDDYNAMFD
ncbi:MAG: DotI/IcmL/TraM family protein [Bdellovibrionales bacterium]